MKLHQKLVNYSLLMRRDEKEGRDDIFARPRSWQSGKFDVKLNIIKLTLKLVVVVLHFNFYILNLHLTLDAD